ncbi:MAG: sigma-54 dependent transcriptional regulator [Reichenbachiella sp.]
MKKYLEKVLLIDDEDSILDISVEMLKSAGFKSVHTLNRSDDAIPFLENNDIDIVTIDLNMPDISGEDLLVKIALNFPHISVIIMSGVVDLDTVISCMKHGAKDYITKPVTFERLTTTILNASKEIRLRKENKRIQSKLLEGSVEHEEAFESLVTQSQYMQSIFAYAEAVATSELPVMITGETGTGKELMAKAIHDIRHKDERFVCCNVAGIDDVAFSDTLFGHLKGSFTGADSDRVGLIEKAQGGTLFLDEIGDLAKESQVKLLRLLQEGEYYPLGSDEPKKSDAWVVVATNCELGNDSNFRKDLYFRLNAHRIELPPLRDRPEDIPLLVKHFVTKYSDKTTEEEIEGLVIEIEEALAHKSLEGNIRELQGFVADMVLTGGALKMPTREVGLNNSELEKVSLSFDRFPKMNEMKNQLIAMALEKSGGNKAEAAKLLGVSSQTVFTAFKELRN